ncbi:MAG: hypothetical protein R2734_15460 [Nocardioides sp.]
MSRRARRAGLAALVAILAVATGCTTTPPPAGTADDHAGLDALQPRDHPVEAWQPEPLRAGERRLELTIPTSYTPRAPYGAGTDDYHCFLLDPQLTQDVFLTGTFVRPDNTDVVHHVILFQVPPEDVARAQELDARSATEGWTCFGDSGLTRGPALDSALAGRLGTGSQGSGRGPGYGVRLAAGTQIVMQVHYNLLGGTGPDASSTLLRVAPATPDMRSVETMLLPAPVELPCRPAHAAGPLCDRDAAVADVVRRFGGDGNTANLLHLLCGGEIRPGNTQSCTRTVTEPTTIRGVAGHMHLLGRSMSIVVNPGTPTERTILDIPLWNLTTRAPSRSSRCT